MKTQVNKVVTTTEEESREEEEADRKRGAKSDSLTLYFLLFLLHVLSDSRLKIQDSSTTAYLLHCIVPRYVPSGTTDANHRFTRSPMQQESRVFDENPDSALPPAHQGPKPWEVNRKAGRISKCKGTRGVARWMMIHSATND